MKDQNWEINIYREAIRKWGFETQIHIAVEEMAELTKALMKYLRRHQTDNFLNVVEEIADVEIILMQLNMLFDHHAIERIKREKLEHLEKLLYPELEPKGS